MMHDWLSGLPDNILVVILSSLPLKEAARTSVLSSRWTNLWRHSLCLNFDADDALLAAHDKLSLKVERTKYVNWLNSVVQSHKSLALDEFRVRFDLDESSWGAITTWLEFAVARRVQRLELNLTRYKDPYIYRPYDTYDFPAEFLGRSTREAPSLFKSLKALCLRAVNVSGEDIEFFLCNCPFLEQLIVQGSRKMSKIDVCGSSLALKHLEIFECHPSGSPIKISAPNLISLKVDALSGLLLENVPMLVELDLKRGYDDLYEHKLVHALDCCIFQLENLTVNLVSSICKKLVFCVFPQMPKLKKLKIEYVLLSDEKLLVLNSFLMASPHLQEFEVKIVGMTSFWNRQVEDENVIRHFEHQHLKVLKLAWYTGCYREIELTKVYEFMRYIPGNCVALERIILVPYVMESPPNRPLTPEQKVIQRNNMSYAKQLLEPLVPDHIQLLILQFSISQYTCDL